MIRRQALEYWKQVTAAAPAGPWHVDASRGSALATAAGEDLGAIASPEGGAFVVAARDALPVLLAELDHLVAIVRDITQAQAQERHCPDCGPLDALGHRKRCRVAPYLR
jgi:hypothetical protein